ncbi:hypothetical protein AYK21_05870 [Thermoplasmatales archaeon SG8-52-2]|nr:MAG: hypothetical protein AYK21_05870 [Thermoplasmatales archaeon SG8-52-2]
MNKSKGLLNKILIIGCIILFIVTIITPEIFADEYKQEIINENKFHFNENETYDNNWEIFTRIEGYARLNWIKIKGTHRSKQFGEAEIIKGEFDGVKIFGIKQTNESKKIFFKRDVEYIYAPCFIGHEMISMAPGHEGYAVFGRAFGNIDWY